MAGVLPPFSFLSDNMKKTDFDQFPLPYMRIQILFLMSSAFILFVIFQNALSYLLLVISIIAIMGSLYYSNCKVFYIKSQNNLQASSRVLTKLIHSGSYLLQLVFVWRILTEGVRFGLENFYQTGGILASEYLSGTCWILASVVVYLAGKLFRNIVFEEMEKEAKKFEPGAD